MYGRTDAQRLHLLLVTLLTLLAPACHRTAKAPDIKIDYEITPQPPKVGTANIDLKLTNNNGQPLSGARIELEGNMSHAGMSPAHGEAHEVEKGKYRGTLELSMAGDWLILVRITLSNGQQLQRQLELNGVRSD